MKKGTSICLVDDDEFYMYSMRRMIELNHLCSSVTECKNGLEAIVFLRMLSTENMPDVIFLDINMPVMNGWEFLDEFEEIAGRFKTKTRLYVVSSSIDTSDRERAKKYAFVTDYIVKPVSIEELVALLK